MNETFEFTDKLKKNLFIMMGTGLLGLLMVFFLYPENNHSRLWANLLVNTYYFTGIAIFGMFAVAAGTLAYGSWHILVKRIFLSISSFARVGGFMLLIIVALGLLNVHTLYDQVKAIIHEPKVSEIHTTKVVFFNPYFWLTRLLAYASLWAFFSWYMDKFFGRTDQTDPKVYKRSKLLAAAFIVTFAVTESAASWDYLMCLDAHWYSTMFGWYNFASYGCGAWAMTILLVIYLKSKGYMARVNENHVHDLGKLLFGFSIFWTYVWFDQFMLQWFANIPEETHYWVHRFDEGYFKFTVFLALTINFVFPLIFLIKRGAKRNFKMIGFGAALLIFGHYVDFFNMAFFEPNKNKAALEEKKEAAVTNSSKVVFLAQAGEKKEAVSDATPAKENTEAVATEVKKEGGAKAEGGKEGGKEGEGEEAPQTNYAAIGIGEILIFIGFLGVFLFMFFNNLKKRPIIPENDPYLKEAERIVVVYS